MQQIQLNKRDALKQDTQCDKCTLVYFGNWLLISGKQQNTPLMSLANKLFCYTHTLRAHLKEWKHTSVARIAALVSSACLRSSAT